MDSSRRLDALTSIGIASSYNKAVLQNLKSKSMRLSQDDINLYYFFIEEMGAEEGVDFLNLPLEEREKFIEKTLGAIKTKKEKVMWVTSGMSNVCVVCDGMDGAVFDIDEADKLERPHPFCNCSFIEYEE